MNPRNLVCIICPMGCRLTAEQTENGFKISGNTCKRGEEYAIHECTNPIRTLTSTIRVADKTDTMVSVKSDKPIPKQELMNAMKKIRSCTVVSPITIGQVLIENIVEGISIVATKEILRCCAFILLCLC